MTDIKTEKIMEISLDYRTFLLLMFGFVRKIDLKNSTMDEIARPYFDKDHPFKIIIEKEYDNSFTMTRVSQMLELHNEFEKADKEGALANSIELSNRDGAEKHSFSFFQVKHSHTFGIEENWKEDDCYSVTEKTLLFPFNAILKFLKSEYDLDSPCYADWFYPLIEQVPPFRCESSNPENLENMINIEELPDTLKVLIECWQNPEAKYKNRSFSDKNEYYKYLFDDVITPLNNRYNISTDNRNKQSDGFAFSHMKAVSFLINYKD